LFHCDCVQTFLISDLGSRISDLGADLVTISAHKIHGPKGAGALYIRAGTKVKPILTGGGQEREMRAGTENVAAIVGFGEAVRLVPTMRDNRRQARDRFLLGLDIKGLEMTVPSTEDVLPGHAHFRIPGVQAETMLILLDRMGISASSGAACSSGSIEPSHVLLACGYSDAEAKEGLRFTFGRETTDEEANDAAKRVSEAAAKLSSGKLTS
jgi:cysteine desulfurase